MTIDLSVVWEWWKLVSSALHIPADLLIIWLAYEYGKRRGP